MNDFGRRLLTHEAAHGCSRRLSKPLRSLAPVPHLAESCYVNPATALG